MTIFTTVVIKSESLDTGLSDIVRVTGEGKQAVRRLINVLDGALSGAKPARVTIKVDSVTVGDKAAEDVVLTQAELTADETLQIGNVTLTWKAAAANENQVTIGDDDIEAAANLAAAIEAHSVLSSVVSAASDGVDTVTITALLPGQIGEMIGLIATQASTGMALGSANLAGVTATVSAAAVDYPLGVA